MTKIIMNGCNGKMGQVITRLVSEDNECEIVAGDGYGIYFSINLHDDCTIQVIRRC